MTTEQQDRPKTFICPTCPPEKNEHKTPPYVHRWVDKHPATDNMMCWDCFMKYLWSADAERTETQ